MCTALDPGVVLLAYAWLQAELGVISSSVLQGIHVPRAVLLLLPLLLSILCPHPGFCLPAAGGFGVAFVCLCPESVTVRPGTQPFPGYKVAGDGFYSSVSFSFSFFVF